MGKPNSGLAHSCETITGWEKSTCPYARHGFNEQRCWCAGKTLIARQIGKMLNGKEPKIVNGPEILNKYVGASEENVRNLFKVRKCSPVVHSA